MTTTFANMQKINYKYPFKKNCVNLYKLKKKKDNLHNNWLRVMQITLIKFFCNFDQS